MPRIDPRFAVWQLAQPMERNSLRPSATAASACAVRRVQGDGRRQAPDVVDQSGALLTREV